MTDSSRKSGHGEKLTLKREAAITALLSGGSLKKSAAACGLSESTLRRWLKESDFLEDYNQAKRQLLDSTINRLRSVGDAGVEGLHAVVSDKNSPAGARVSAGRAIIELLLRAVEVQDLSDRLAKLEDAMKGEER